jgi:hypothetical protein
MYKIWKNIVLMALTPMELHIDEYRPGGLWEKPAGATPKLENVQGFA